MEEMTNTAVATAQPETEVVVKPYVFRQLCGEDIFPMIRIIGKIGVKEFNACFENNGIRKLATQLMGNQEKDKDEDKDDSSASVTYIEIILEVADVIFKNLPKCENEIFQLLSQTSNLSIKQIKALDIAQAFEMLIDFIKKDEFRDFIKVASKFIK